MTTTSAFTYPRPTQTAPATPNAYNGTASNTTYPIHDTSACAATAPSQLLTNPSFECSESGWTLDDVEIVWGGVPDSSPPSKRKNRRDISSPDLAYDGVAFARFKPSYEDVTATLSQTLDTPATNGSYWYSFAYRIPSSSGSVVGCTLSVSSDEGVLGTVGPLSYASAGAWTMTGKEFDVVESVSTFSFVFACTGGTSSSSPMLDVDNIRLGVSSGSWAGNNGTTGGYINSTGLMNLTAPAYADSSVAGNVYVVPSTTSRAAEPSVTTAANEYASTTTTVAADPTILANVEPSTTAADATTTTATDPEPAAYTLKVKRHRYHTGGRYRT